jgi:hypothetical protein
VDGHRAAAEVLRHLRLSPFGLLIDPDCSPDREVGLAHELLERGVQGKEGKVVIAPRCQRDRRGGDMPRRSPVY